MARKSYVPTLLDSTSVTAEAERSASAAVAALLIEAWLSPKPGLVDRYSSNAHDDMDYQLLRESAFSLKNGFAMIYTAAFHGSGEDPSQLFHQSLRPIGYQSEQMMLRASGGVNCHKGALFLLGLLTAARAHCDARGTHPKLLRLCSCIASMTKGLSCEADGGARKEAEMGLPQVRRAYPKLRQQLNRDQLKALADELYKVEDSEKQHEDLEIPLTRTLIALCSEVCDSNILRRSSHDILRRFQKKSAEILAWSEEHHREEKKAYQQLCQFCLSHRISPGGSADLLSCLIYIRLIDGEK